MALKQRVLTAAILIPVVLLAIMALAPWMFAILIAGIVALAAWEWSGLSGLRTNAARFIYVLAILAALYLVGVTLPVEQARTVLYIGLAWWIAGFFLVLAYETRVFEFRLTIPARLLIGFLVLVPAWWSVAQLRGESDNVAPVLFFLVLIWVTDSAAYFSGKRWGKRRLAPRVSPGKSWEGVIVSLLAVMALAWPGTDWVLGTQASEAGFVALSILTAGFSVLGDLIESLVKRAAAFKDSGSLLPGHGGIMDRIDSLTAAAPVFLMGLIFMGSNA
ncbi:MAG: phosphatidate cytidylyltransferase [Gammaproteobacteria bacterium]|nr:phosphatidate cytidylyltransferase [Gammaproteobacteria bacterium]